MAYRLLLDENVEHEVLHRLENYSGSEAKAHPFRGVDKADMIGHKQRDVGWL